MGLAPPHLSTPPRPLRGAARRLRVRGSRVELRPLRGLAPLDRLAGHRRFAPATAGSPLGTRQIPPSRFVERSRCKHSRVRRAQKVSGLPGSFVARDLQQSLNVLVGRNNVGKTSLLAAMYFSTRETN